MMETFGDGSISLRGRSSVRYCSVSVSGIRLPSLVILPQMPTVLGAGHVQ